MVCVSFFFFFQMPLAKGFSVADVRAAVGSRRLVDVVDCDSRKTSTMTLKDWHRCVEEEVEI